MPALEIVALDTATPQILAPQTGDTYSAPRALAISPQSLTGTSATTSLDIAQTWNTTGTPTAVKLNVTDTASNAASLLMDLQVGGVSKFKVPKNGNPVFVVPTSGYLEVNGNGDGLRAVNSSSVSAYSVYGVRMGASNTLSWGSSADGPATADTILARDAADTLALRRTTNAQTFRVYNTYTDASNYERGFLKWNTNVLEIGTEAAGTGTARDVSLTAGAGSIRIAGSATGGIAIGNVSPEGNNRLTLTPNVRLGGTFFGLTSSTVFGWGTSSWVNDTTLIRVAAGIVGVRDATTGGAAVSLVEQTAPAAPATNGVYIYAQDNGAGKTQLMARFATGAAQQIAIEP